VKCGVRNAECGIRVISRELVVSVFNAKEGTTKHTDHTKRHEARMRSLTVFLSADWADILFAHAASCVGSALNVLYVRQFLNADLTDLTD
jgi:hypothetical protein